MVEYESQDKAKYKPMSGISTAVLPVRIGSLDNRTILVGLKRQTGLDSLLCEKTVRHCQ